MNDLVTCINDLIRHIYMTNKALSSTYKAMYMNLYPVNMS